MNMFLNICTNIYFNETMVDYGYVLDYFQMGVLHLYKTFCITDLTPGSPMALLN